MMDSIALTVSVTRARGPVIVGGDWNARIGSLMVSEHCSYACEGEHDGRGRLLADWAAANRLVPLGRHTVADAERQRARGRAGAGGEDPEQAPAVSGGVGPGPEEPEPYTFRGNKRVDREPLYRTRPDHAFITQEHVADVVGVEVLPPWKVRTTSEVPGQEWRWASDHLAIVVTLRSHGPRRHDVAAQRRKGQFPAARPLLPRVGDAAWDNPGLKQACMEQAALVGNAGPEGVPEELRRAALEAFEGYQRPRPGSVGGTGLAGALAERKRQAKGQLRVALRTGGALGAHLVAQARAWLHQTTAALAKVAGKRASSQRKLCASEAAERRERAQAGIAASGARRGSPNMEKFREYMAGRMEGDAAATPPHEAEILREADAATRREVRDHAAAVAPGVRDAVCDAPITLEEVVRAIRRLNSGRSPGPDGLSVEMLRGLGDAGAALALACIRQVWLTKKWPASWSFTRGAAVPKGPSPDPEKPEQFRMVASGQVLAKIMLHVLRERISAVVVPALNPCQMGFVPGGRTEFAALPVLETLRYWAHAEGDGSPGVGGLLQLDVAKAFDEVPRDRLLAVLWERWGIRGTLWALLRQYLSASEVHLPGQQPIRYCVGVPQGCVLSPLLFAIYVDPVARAMTPPALLRLEEMNRGDQPADELERAEAREAVRRGWPVDEPGAVGVLFADDAGVWGWCPVQIAVLAAAVVMALIALGLRLNLDKSVLQVVVGPQRAGRRGGPSPARRRERVRAAFRDAVADEMAKRGMQAPSLPAVVSRGAPPPPEGATRTPKAAREQKRRAEDRALGSASVRVLGHRVGANGSTSLQQSVMRYAALKAGRSAAAAARAAGAGARQVVASTRTYFVPLCDWGRGVPSVGYDTQARMEEVDRADDVAYARALAPGLFAPTWREDKRIATEQRQLAGTRSEAALEDVRLALAQDTEAVQEHKGRPPHRTVVVAAGCLPAGVRRRLYMRRLLMALEARGPGCPAMYILRGVAAAAASHKGSRGRLWGTRLLEELGAERGEAGDTRRVTLQREDAVMRAKEEDRLEGYGGLAHVRANGGAGLAAGALEFVGVAEGAAGGVPRAGWILRNVSSFGTGLGSDTERYKHAPGGGARVAWADRLCGFCDSEEAVETVEHVFLDCPSVVGKDLRSSFAEGVQTLLRACRRPCQCGAPHDGERVQGGAASRGGATRGGGEAGPAGSLGGDAGEPRGAAAGGGDGARPGGPAQAQGRGSAGSWLIPQSATGGAPPQPPPRTVMWAALFGRVRALGSAAGCCEHGARRCPLVKGLVNLAADLSARLHAAASARGSVRPDPGGGGGGARRRPPRGRTGVARGGGASGEDGAAAGGRSWR